MSGVRRVAIAGLVWGLLVLPSAAEACAVCAGGENEQSVTAFRFATAALSLLPLAMIGGGMLWLRRRLRQVEGDELESTARVSVPR